MSQLMGFFTLFSFVLLVANIFPKESNVGSGGKDLAFRDNNKKQKHIVLLGASIGSRWSIPLFPERVNEYKYMFEYVHGGSEFDKSHKLSKILQRQDHKPDAIFLKECAAYFPGDLSHYKNLMKYWIKECFKAGVFPIPVTVVPVTRLHPFKQILIDILKRRNPLRFGSPFKHWRNKAIIEYNDWIRSFCGKSGLFVLDLEVAVRYSEDNRYLREDLSTIDGLHLNNKAYNILDQIVIPFLDLVKWENKT